MVSSILRKVFYYVNFNPVPIPIFRGGLYETPLDPSLGSPRRRPSRVREAAQSGRLHSRRHGGQPHLHRPRRWGAKTHREIPGASIKVFEAGFNQAEWQEKLTSFVATGNYDFILTSNPSMPDLIAAVSPLFLSRSSSASMV